jgi:hypothetical protein
MINKESDGNSRKEMSNLERKYRHFLLKKVPDVWGKI